jgi:hypothetical protein
VLKVDKKFVEYQRRRFKLDYDFIEIKSRPFERENRG